MDNQFYPPNGGYPQGQPPQQGYAPQSYGPQTQQPMQNPYEASYGMPPAGYQQPQGGYNPYDLQQAGYAAYTQPQQGDAQPDSYQQTGYQQTGYQQPYGGMQQPYAEDGYQYHFDHSQSVMQEQQAPTGFPQQELRPRKPRIKLTSFHVAIIVAALGFLGWYLYATLVPEAATHGMITSGNLSATHAGDCLIVRNEVPYDAEGVTSVVYDAEEGSYVTRTSYDENGDAHATVICRVYSSGYSTREMNTLLSYRSSIRNYQKKLIESETTYDARLNRVTSDVMTCVRAVRDLIAGGRGSLENQEKMLAGAVQARQDYIKNKYASDQRLSRLLDDELSQTQRIHSWTKQKTVEKEGLVSFYSDGYEYGLTGKNYTTFEPREVRAMINGNAPEKTAAQKGKTTIYRMVEDGEWYVLFLSRDTEWNPVQGQIYQLQLERFENTVVYAEVVSFTRSGGELLVRLKVNGSVQPVLYMRTCGALLGENISTLCVPERAIYVQDGMTGVVVVDNHTESFIPVNVIHYEGGNAYFQAIQQGLLFEGMTVLLF